MKAELLIHSHLDRLAAQHATVTERAEHWRRVAFMWCSGCVILAAVIIVFTIVWMATR